MKKIFVLILAVCCLAPMAHADDAAKKAKSEKLVELMHMDKVMGQMVDMIKVQMNQAMSQSADKETMTPKQKEIMADFQKKVLDLIMGYISWSVMKPDVVKVYVDTFTEEELDGMIAFYSSPTGQAVLAKMPEAMQSSMTLTQARMVDLQPKLKAMAEDFAAQMKAAAPAK